MSQDPLDYNLLLQQALRGLVRQSLAIVAAQGMPGDHHFYVTFRTDAPGVRVPPHLRESYPEEMTIVLKTQFHDLSVEDDAFTVGLFFSGVRYDLTIPFAGLVSFADPAVGFQLTFQAAPEEEIAEEEDPAEAAPESDAVALGDNVVSFPGSRRR